LKQVFRFDENGYFLEPVILKDNETIPNDCTDGRPPNGLYKPKFVDGAWVHGLTQEEIDAIVNVPKPISETELLKKQVADLQYELMVNGVI
jgi:hypothetical protein